MHGVDAGVVRLAVGLWRRTLADGHRGWLRPAPHGAHCTICRGAARVVDMAVGDRRETLDTWVPRAPRTGAAGPPARPARTSAGRSHRHPPAPGCRPRCSGGKGRPPLPPRRSGDRPRIAPLPHEALRLLARHARHSDQEPQHHVLVGLAELPVAETLQQISYKP